MGHGLWLFERRHLGRRLIGDLDRSDLPDGRIVQETVAPSEIRRVMVRKEGKGSEVNRFKWLPRITQMNARVRRTLIASVALPIALSLWPLDSPAQGTRVMTVRDCIEKVSFVGDVRNGEEIARFSPDGRYFFVVTKRGVLQSNQTESTIWLFSTADVLEVLKHPSSTRIPDPQALVKMATLANGDPITEARWSADGNSIAFLGRDRDSERHLFVVTVRDKRLKRLTPDGQDVTGFDRAKDIFIFTTVPSVTAAQLYQSGGSTLPDMQLGTGLSLFTLLYPEWEKFTFGVRPRRLWQMRGRKTSPVVDAGIGVQLSLVSRSYSTVISLSPSGHYAVVTNIAAHVPAAWESYESKYASSFYKIIADESGKEPKIDFFRPLQYELIDLRNGNMSPLVDAPLGEATGFYNPPRAVWSQDESEVALTNTFLPLDEPATNHPTRPCVTVVAIATRNVECVKESPAADRDKPSTARLFSLEWRASGQQLLLRYIDSPFQPATPHELFERESGIWKAVTNPSAIDLALKESPGPEFSIDVHESVNEPPVLTATDANGVESKRIWDPNPLFNKIKYGQASVYKWRDEAGHEWTGGLVKPPDYIDGRRYPLVIQTHGFNPHEFLTDGYSATANAARPLASRGIVVLQIGEITTDALGTPREPAENGREGYVAAIEKLASEGLVDSRRVGIIGFSRTGWYVLDSLIHEPKYFVAATLAESTYESFGEYVLNADYTGTQRAKGIAEGIGSEPFGAGIKQWISDSPGFNTDKIQVPVLFEADNPPFLIYSWDIYAALRLQRKPVELLYFRNGEHVLTKPLERLASQEITVDWYDFWLNRHEDPDPAKAEQYARWRELRKLQGASVKPDASSR